MRARNALLLCLSLSICGCEGAPPEADALTRALVLSYTSVSPLTGPPGTQVTITGAGMDLVYKVEFGGIGTTSIDSATSTSLNVTVPSVGATGKLRLYAKDSNSFVETPETFVVISPGAPTITSITPDPALPGGQIIVAGTNFVGISSVTLGGVPVLYNVQGDGLSMYINLSPSAVAAPLEITNSVGTATAMVNIPPHPRCTSFSPSTATGAQTITVTGTGLASTTGFGLLRGSGTVSSATDTTVTFVVPAVAIAGPVHLMAGGFDVTCPGFLTIGAASAPVVTNVSATLIGMYPGGELSVTGSNFRGTTGITIGGQPAVFEIQSNTSLIVSATRPGSGTVAVTNAAGTGTSAASVTVYGPPRIDTISPLPITAGAEITINGDYFADTIGKSRVSLGDKDLTITASSKTQIKCTGAIPRRLPASLKVTNNDTTLTGAFPGYAPVASTDAPTITSFSPTTGLYDTVVVTGTNIIGVSDIFIGGVRVISYNTPTGTQISFGLPTDFPDGPITIVTAGGTATSAESFVRTKSTITDVSPNTGSYGDQITITGTNLSVVSGVLFGSVQVTAFDSKSATQIKLKVPYGAKPNFLTTNTGGRSPLPFLVTMPPPVISGFFPPVAISGGTVNVAGGNLSGTLAVTINDVPAEFHVYSDVAISITVPVGVVSGSIKIFTPGGVVTSAAPLGVGATTTIAGFSPASGSPGTEVTITGTQLDAVRAVRFGTAVYEIEHDSAAQIRVVVPFSARSGPLVLDYSGFYGGTTVQSATPFTVTGSYTHGPVLYSVPATLIRGQNVAVAGAYLDGATATLDGKPIALEQTDFEQLIFKVPADASSGSFVVTTPQGIATWPFPILVAGQAVVTALSPQTGKPGDTITVTGSVLTGARLYIGASAVALDKVKYLDDNTIELTIPTGVVTGLVRAELPQSFAPGTQTLTVTSLGAPSVSAFSPATGIPGDLVRIEGDHFSGLTKLTFGTGVATSVTVLSDAVLIANVPSDASTGKLTITNSVGSASSAADFVLPGAPTVTNVTPTFAAPGDTITITGTNLVTTSKVIFTGGLAAGFVAGSDTQLAITVPEGAQTGPITVIALGGGAKSASVTIDNTPTLVSIDPTSGFEQGGTVVTLAGSSFDIDAQVFIDGSEVEAVYVSSQQLQVTTAPHAPAVVDVQVKNTGGKTTTLVGAYTYVAHTIDLLPPPATDLASSGDDLAGEPVDLGVASDLSPTTATDLSGGADLATIAKKSGGCSATGQEPPVGPALLLALALGLARLSTARAGAARRRRPS